jgi:hypothetical protein
MVKPLDMEWFYHFNIFAFKIIYVTIVSVDFIEQSKQINATRNLIVILCYDLQICNLTSKKIIGPCSKLPSNKINYMPLLFYTNLANITFY